MSIIAIGHNNFIPKDKIYGFYQINSRPIRAKITLARTQDKLIDATNGKKSKTVILLADDYVVLSSISPKTLAERFDIDNLLN